MNGDGVDWLPGESDRDEPELARAGRVMLAERIDRHASKLRQRSRGVLNRAYDGEDLTQEDVRALRGQLDQLESWIDLYAEPVADDVVTSDATDPVVDLAEEYGEADP